MSEETKQDKQMSFFVDRRTDGFVEKIRAAYDDAKMRQLGSKERLKKRTSKSDILREALCIGLKCITKSLPESCPKAPTFPDELLVNRFSPDLEQARPWDLGEFEPDVRRVYAQWGPEEMQSLERAIKKNAIDLNEIRMRRHSDAVKGRTPNQALEKNPPNIAMILDEVIRAGVRTLLDGKQTTAITEKPSRNGEAAIGMTTADHLQAQINSLERIVETILTALHQKAKEPSITLPPGGSQMTPPRPPQQVQTEASAMARLNRMAQERLVALSRQHSSEPSPPKILRATPVIVDAQEAMTDEWLRQEREARILEERQAVERATVTPCPSSDPNVQFEYQKSALRENWAEMIANRRLRCASMGLPWREETDGALPTADTLAKTFLKKTETAPRL